LEAEKKTGFNGLLSVGGRGMRKEVCTNWGRGSKMIKKDNMMLFLLNNGCRVTVKTNGDRQSGLTNFIIGEAALTAYLKRLIPFGR